VDYGCQIKLSRADNYAISVSIDDNLQQYLQVSVSGNTLQIGLKPSVTGSYNNIYFSAHVSLPELDGLALNGAASAP
jgi:hypothetical protein